MFLDNVISCFFRNVRSHTLTIIILVSAAVLTGAIPAFAQDGADGQPARRIHLGDLIDVDLVGSVEYDWRGSLTPEGFLDGLDQIPKQIYALCRTEEEVAAEISAEYSRILRNPNVVVRILDTSNRAVTLMNGAIRTPHRFRVQRPVLLNELIILAGGLTDAASGEIRIQRPIGLSCSGADLERSSQGPNVTTVKIADLIKGVPEANPRILSGDIVTILEAYPIYVIGGVRRPGAIDARSKVTLSRAVAISGGLADGARREDVTIYRRAAGVSTVIKANLRTIESETESDPELQPFDIVDIGEKGRAERRFPPDFDSIGRRYAGAGNPPLKIID
jgi:protein involved in polysaccharide export with SLBB domain